jgi:hypothetical protein
MQSHHLHLVPMFGIPDEPEDFLVVVILVQNGAVTTR